MTERLPRIRALPESSGRLLHAALDTDTRAIEHWRDWLARAGGLDGLDAGEFRLLPLVYRNLKVLGYEEPSEMGRLHGIYRQTWYRNRIAEARMLEATNALEQAGIESLALKGMGLIGLAYREPGVRPMNDVDLLVHGRDLRRAVEVLAAEGWQPAQARADELMRFARLFHAVLLRHPTGIELDLHRHILEESNWPHADDGVWVRQRTIELSGRAVATMSPTDHLIQAIVHGVRWDPVPPIRWIPDAVVLIRTGAIDWDVLATESERRGVALAMRAGLEFLNDEFDQEIPAGTISRLQAIVAGRLERIDFRFEQAGSGAGTHMMRYLTRYLRLTSNRGVVERMRLFPLYLRAMWGLDSAWQIPADGLRRTWIRARGGDPGRPGTPS